MVDKTEIFVFVIYGEGFVKRHRRCFFWGGGDITNKKDLRKCCATVRMRSATGNTWSTRSACTPNFPPKPLEVSTWEQCLDSLLW